MDTVLLLPDGVGIRNFVLTPFLSRLSDRGQVTAYHNVSDDVLNAHREIFSPRVDWRALMSLRDRPLSFLLRNTLAYAHLWYGDTQAMRYARRMPVRGVWAKRAAVHAARLAGRMAASPGGIRTLDRWHCNAVRGQQEVDAYRRQLESVRPSVLFCSHQRPLEILAPTLAANSLGIPTVCFIFSWDNLTSKGRIAAPFDHFVVWSELMRQELLEFYPDVSADRVHVVGTPQFEPYADPQLLWTRDEFFRRVGADPSRCLICYSGGDANTTPEDPDHVRVLLEAIRRGEIPGRPQVLVRPTPVENTQDGGRYQAVCREFPDLIFAPPAWLHPRRGEWNRFIPTPDDIQFLANLTTHADLNVNMASTMTLDFAVHDKPVVNIAFDVANPPPFKVPVWEYYYRYEHYRPVVEIGAARFARSPAELVEHVNAYLRDPSLDRDARRKLVDLHIGCPLVESSQRIIDVLSQVAR